MKAVTAGQMQWLDRQAIDVEGIPGIDLMERAGAGVAATIRSRFPPDVFPLVLVVCGKGNNGGDGFVIARLLSGGEYKPVVALLGRAADVDPGGDAGVNLKRWIDSGGGFHEIAGDRGIEKLARLAETADMVVDAMLGTGLKGPVRGKTAEAIRLLSESGYPVVAVDTPTGVDNDSGEVPGDALPAHVTVTMALPKLGHLFFPARGYVGDLEVVDIGIPPETESLSESRIFATSRRRVAEALPARSPDCHKGRCGRVLVIGGSPGFTGAVVLTAGAAVRSGAGLVHAAAPAALNPILENKLTEAMTLPVSGCADNSRFGGEDDLEQCLEFASGMDAVALGPGMGTAPETVDFVSGFIERLEIPCLVDADGLNCLSRNPGLVRGKAVILTPHPGEMARITGKSISGITGDPVGAARSLSADLGVIVVLKGAPTVTALPGGRLFVNTTGNPGMAAGGSGDVLTGLMAGFMARGMTMDDAAVSAVYIHGLAADFAFEKFGVHLTAGDIADRIADAVSSLFFEPAAEGLPELLIDQDWLFSPLVNRF